MEGASLDVAPAPVGAGKSCCVDVRPSPVEAETCGTVVLEPTPADGERSAAYMDGGTPDALSNPAIAAFF